VATAELLVEVLSSEDAGMGDRALVDMTNATWICDVGDLRPASFELLISN
jgi:hypothetical protein